MDSRLNAAASRIQDERDWSARSISHTRKL